MFGFFFCLLPICSICIAIGYIMLIRQVWHRPDRKAQIKRILFTSADPQSLRDNPRAIGFIVFGALCGFVGCIGLLVWILRNGRW